MAKWKEFPSPEAIVRTALERAANILALNGEYMAEEIVWIIANEENEVAAIIKAAGEDRADQSGRSNVAHLVERHDP